MSTSYTQAVDAILNKLKLKWDTESPGLNGGVLPHLVYEFLEADLKPHPKDSGQSWARVVVRHTDAVKPTLTDSSKVARFRRHGEVIVEVYVPAIDGSAWIKTHALADVAYRAYVGRRTLVGSGASVCFTHTQLIDQPRDGAWVRKDVKAHFYWDQVR